jgi:hypothetical protein
MRVKKQTGTASEPREGGAIQVEVTLLVRQRRPKAKPDARTVPSVESAGSPRIPRVARLMALAIKFQDLVDRREVVDYADLARLGYVTRARLTQIMNLLHLAPDIQERLLDCCEERQSAGAITERDLRDVSRIVDWASQRQIFSLITR